MLTIPNALTFLRILLVACFAALLLGRRERVAAALVLGAVGLTDFLDGYLARKMGQVSKLGKVLDPVADRVALGTALVATMAYGAVPIWLAATILVREAVVAAATVVLGLLGGVRVDVSLAGKASTFGLYTSLPLFLLGDGRGHAAGVAKAAAYGIAIPALVGSIGAAVGYVPAARRALSEGRAGRKTGALGGPEAIEAGSGGDLGAGEDRAQAQAAT